MAPAGRVALPGLIVIVTEDGAFEPVEFEPPALAIPVHPDWVANTNRTARESKRQHALPQGRAPHMSIGTSSFLWLARIDISRLTTDTLVSRPTGFLLVRGTVVGQAPEPGQEARDRWFGGYVTVFVLGTYESS